MPEARVLTTVCTGAFKHGTNRMDREKPWEVTREQRDEEPPGML